MTITRNGTPVAVVSPLPSPRLSAAALLERWKNLHVIDRDQLREGIAATALAHDLPLYTRNPRDFEGITNLDVRAV